jgi:TrfA protein
MTTLDTLLKRQLEELERKSAERSLSKDILLPEWPESKRGTPNTFLRSALFSVNDCKKDRVQLKDTVVASQEGITVLYTGEQLNQEDLTLWETLVHMAKEHPLGYVCDFTAYEILKSMKYTNGGHDYERLDKGIMRLVNCSVTIKQGHGRFIGHLIESAIIDEKTHHYKIDLGRKLTQLYGESTWIDAEQRLQLRRKSLAQFLHGYYSSHKTPYPVKVATLHQLSGSGVKELKRFKQSLKAALEELIKIEFLDSYHIENDLVTVKRK